jgi:hypothetical protein
VFEQEIDRQEKLKVCQERQAEKDACVRPRTYPKFKGVGRYTDYYDK